MFTDWVRRRGRGVIDPIARVVARTGLSPNTVTVIGLLLMLLVGLVLSQGYFQVGGGLLILAAIFDAIDGAMARLYNRATRFGAFFDSTLDRFAEAAVFLGILVYFEQQGSSTQVILAYVTIVGSLMVSYTRARAEGIGLSIKGGFLTRLERMLILIVGLLLNLPTVALIILAPLTNFTALQRMWLTWRATQQQTDL